MDRHYFLDAIIEGVEAALNFAVDQGILSAHESKSSYRFRILRDELASMEKNIKLLTDRKKPSPSEIRAFEKKYREQVEIRHGNITPPNFDGLQKQPIDELYVCPNFIRNAEEKGKEPQTLSYDEFIAGSYRSVILGNPGAGKSAFSLKLCHDLATRYEGRLLAGRTLTPILVVLRDYGAKKKDQNCSIIEYIASVANSNYQIKPPVEAFPYLLLNGRAAVIFDGLDELTDTRYRKEITSDIEAFCNLYPAAPVIVTSREVGYMQAPLDSKLFALHNLASFSDEQVEQYVMRWYNLDVELTEAECGSKATAFMAESKSVSDLRSNPLLLALLCNIYRGAGYLPKNRPGVYEKCAEMLFERWDKSRDIGKILPFESQVRPALMHLAHWIYTTPELQTGITEQRLIAKTTEYLCEKRYDDCDEARQAAKEFIQFCRGRAWVFTDTGSTGSGESLYQFTHRTFLEYFTAVHLYRTQSTPAKLKKVLFPRIAREEWDIVAQLAFQIIDKNIDLAGDMLLETLLKEARKSKGKRMWNYLLFAAKVLAFIIPTPKVLKEITAVIFEACVEFGCGELCDSERKVSFDKRLPPSILGALLCASIENRKIISHTLETLFTERINQGRENEAIIALHIAKGIPTFTLHFLIRIGTASADHGYWKSFFGQLIKKYTTRVRYFAEKDYLVCSDGWCLKLISIDSFIEWHGVSKLFFEKEFYFYKGVFRVAAIEMILGGGSRLSDLKLLGQRLLDLTAPYVSYSNISTIHSIDAIVSNSRSIVQKVTDNDSLFAILIVIYIALEYCELGTSEALSSKEILGVFLNSESPASLILVASMKARLSGKPEDFTAARSKLGRFNLSQAQKTLLLKWICNEVDFVEQE
ncbi:MAG: NACHT domain-containing protein [bacterium]|nr:NACHT domain-containing protein [bacterium]